MAQRSATDDEEQGNLCSWREFFGHVSLPALSFVCLAVWLHAADALIVATMLPSIVATIGGAGLVSWSIALYEICFCGGRGRQCSSRCVTGCARPCSWLRWPLALAAF